MSYLTPRSEKQIPEFHEDPDALASRDLFLANDTSTILADMRRFLLAELHRLLSRAEFGKRPIHELADTVLATGPLHGYILRLAHKETIGKITRYFHPEYLDHVKDAPIRPLWPAHSLYLDAVCEPDLPRAINS